jgi:hypothetical protein
VTLPVVADADTLFAATTRGLLIYLDYHGLINLHWSPLILDEVCRALVKTGRKKTMVDAKAHEKRMCDALPNALVSIRAVQAQFQAVAAAVRSEKDTHVAACAYCLIASNAYPKTSVIALVTKNAKDFRKAELAKLGITLQKPDAFLAELARRYPSEVKAAFEQFRANLKSQPTTEILLTYLVRDGLVETVQGLQAATV